MKKNQIPAYALALGLIILLVVLITVFFKTAFIPRNEPGTLRVPGQKLPANQAGLKTEMSKPPQRIESRLSGEILSVKTKAIDEVEFTLLDESLKKEFVFRLSNRAAISNKTVDTEKDVITITTATGKNPFALIKIGSRAMVTTIDPLDAHGPLQALRVTVSKPPSKKQ